MLLLHPDKHIPLEWIKKPLPEPEDPYSLVEDIERVTPEERVNIEKFMRGLGVDTGERDSFLRGKKSGYFKPDYLEHLEEVKRKEKENE